MNTDQMTPTPTPRTDEFERAECCDLEHALDFARELEIDLAREKRRAEDNGRLAHDTAIKLAAERALADRLGNWMQEHRKAWQWQNVDPDCDCEDCVFLVPFDEALAAWKEARGA